MPKNDQIAVAEFRKYWFKVTQKGKTPSPHDAFIAGYVLARERFLDKPDAIDEYVTAARAATQA